MDRAVECVKPGELFFCVKPGESVFENLEFKTLFQSKSTVKDNSVQNLVHCFLILVQWNFNIKALPSNTDLPLSHTRYLGGVPVEWVRPHREEGRQQGGA